MNEVKMLEKELDRAHKIIMCFIAFLFMCALLLFVYFYTSDMEISKEIVKITSDDESDAIYQSGEGNQITKGVD